MDFKLRVQRGIKIEVNDEGEYIIADINDMAFVDRFYSIADSMMNISEELEKPEIAGMEEKKRLEIMIDRTRDIMNDFDSLFGAEACRKVFGSGVVPAPFLFIDFFEGLMPVFEQYADARQKKISEKYSKNRKGRR